MMNDSYRAARRQRLRHRQIEMGIARFDIFSLVTNFGLIHDLAVKTDKSHMQMTRDRATAGMRRVNSPRSVIAFSVVCR